MENNIKVSVCCTAYNHADFIEQTIKGFLSQETNFRFEVIIHDDASPDNTAEIIRKYEKEYPDIIKGIYQTENQHSQKNPFVRNNVLPIMRGEYVAICEGDDYWTDPHKLQEQVDAMDKHKDCYFCVHKTKEILVTGEDTGKTFPDFSVEDPIINSMDFLTYCSKGYSFHTSSYMFRMAEWAAYVNDPPRFKKVCDVGDEPYMMYFGHLGNVYYIDKVMSAYRRGVPNSWTSRNSVTTDINRLIRHPSAMIETYCEFDKYTDGIYRNLYAPKIASMKLHVYLYTKKCKKLLTKEEKQYFNLLSKKNKLVVIAASVFPGLVLKYYLGRRKRLYKRKGYVQ